MIEKHPNYELLNFTYVAMGKPEFSGNNVKIPVRSFAIDPGFPGYEGEDLVIEGYLIFDNITYCVQTIDEYTSTEDIKPTYSINHGPFPEHPQQDVYLWEFDGVSFDPPGWVIWEIHASFGGVEKIK